MLSAHLQEIKTRSNNGILLEMTGKQQGEKHSDLSEAQEPSRPSDPEEVREELIALHKRGDTASGGKAFWAESCRSIGLVDSEDGIQLNSNNNGETANVEGYDAAPLRALAPAA